MPIVWRRLYTPDPTNAPGVQVEIEITITDDGSVTAVQIDNPAEQYNGNIMLSIADDPVCILTDDGFEKYDRSSWKPMG